MSVPCLTVQRLGILAVSGVALGLLGCAGMPGSSSCPDLGGTYVNQAEDSRNRLSVLLMPENTAGAPRTVSLSLDGEPRRLVVAAGAQHAALEQGRDFTCDNGTLRLVEPMQRRINLGGFLKQDVETTHALSKNADGSLQAVTWTREHSVLYGKPVTGPQRRGVTDRWLPVAPSSVR